MVTFGTSVAGVLATAACSYGGCRGDVTLMFVAKAYSGREYEGSVSFRCR